MDAHSGTPVAGGMHDDVAGPIVGKVALGRPLVLGVAKAGRIRTPAASNNLAGIT